MKNSIKKITAIILVVIMLMSVIPLQSFAAFEGLKKSLIEKIELSENSPSISLKELDNYYKELFKMLEDSELDLDYIKENMPGIYSALFNFDLAYSGFDYKFDVTLRSGDTYTVSAEDSYIEYNKIYDIYAAGYIEYETYLAAKESGAEEIEVKLYGDINNLLSDYSDSAEYTSKDTLPLIDMVVKSITPVSGIPEEFYFDSDYVDVEGAKFLIEYADGVAITAEVSQKITLNSDFYGSKAEYYLDGNKLYADYYSEYDKETDEETYLYRFDYLDAYYTSPAVLSEEPLFKIIRITDCSFDAKSAILSSITYELTYQDDTTVSFTKNFTEQEAALLALGAAINALDGYFVSVYVSLGDYDISNDTINADTYSVTVTAGINSDTFKVENPHKDIMNGSLNVIYFFKDLFDRIRNFFYNIFDIIIFAF